MSSKNILVAGASAVVGYTVGRFISKQETRGTVNEQSHDERWEAPTTTLEIEKKMVQRFAGLLREAIDDNVSPEHPFLQHDIRKLENKFSIKLSKNRSAPSDFPIEVEVTDRERFCLMSVVLERPISGVN